VAGGVYEKVRFGMYFVCACVYVCMCVCVYGCVCVQDGEVLEEMKAQLEAFANEDGALFSPSFH
jgi:hypothetical protein